MELFLLVLPSAAVIFFALHWLLRHLKEAPPSGAPPLVEAAPERPRIFARFEEGAGVKELFALTASDHYVEAMTDQGVKLCLLRLSDAIAETAPLAGFHIHRSHWVALSAVERITQAEGKPRVVLVGGAVLPVSRSRLKALREALARHPSPPPPS